MNDLLPVFKRVKLQINRLYISIMGGNIFHIFALSLLLTIISVTECRILSEIPAITPVRNDNTRINVGVQPAEDYVALIVNEKVRLIQNELYTANEQLSNAKDELVKKDNELKLLKADLQDRVTMEARLKYAIANATISGDGWTCNTPNPMIYPTGDRYCWIPSGNWVNFDLKEKFTINLIRFRLYDQDARVYTYNLHVSSDYRNWISIAEGATGQSAQEYLLKKALQIRYIKMEGRNTLNAQLHLNTLTVDWV
ncbi:hypothetical protein LOD99_7606 [Oopsacas minuta]|uniref:F5/8 type C domain-containing protein n=1 Tax=Oopsacas minuta TaxID=111878 RepID=A0AAV7JNZ7_9METZ|nr:hypothetical protein LOD99_7606 [Oopsacas minuta]